MHTFIKLAYKNKYSVEKSRILTKLRKQASGIDEITDKSEGKMWIGLVSFGLLLLSLTHEVAHAGGELICDDKKFIFEKGFFSSSVTQIIDDESVPFCISDSPETVTRKLSFRDLEIWCVTTHRVSSGSRPLAKNLWILNRSANKLYQYEYLFSNGEWLLEDEHHKLCSGSEGK